MSDNPYDTSAPQPQAQSQLNPYGGFGFLSPPSNPNAPGLFASQGTGYGLANLGANIIAAANARTGGGFLANPGVIGALGSGLAATLRQGQQDVATRAGLNSVNAKTIGEQLANEKSRLELEFLKFKYPWLIQQLQNGGGLTDNGTGLPPGVAPGTLPTVGTQPPATTPPASTGGGDTPPVTPAPVTGGTGHAALVPNSVRAAFKATEGDGTGKTGLNQLGFAGNYQMGTAALADAGLYKPAEGEDLTKNQWRGQITIPGYAPMTVAQFIENPQAQEQAFGIHMGNLAHRAHTLGLDSYLGQTVGGVKITPETLAALEHHAGAAGTLRFLQSNGAYDPADANGLHPSEFAQRITSTLTSKNANVPPGWFLARQTPGLGLGDDTGTTTGSGTGDPTGTGDTTGTDMAALSRPYQEAQAGDGSQPPPSGGSGSPAARPPAPEAVAGDVGAIMGGIKRAGGSVSGAPQGTQEAQAGPGPYAVHPGQTQPPAAPPGYWTPQQAMQRALYLRGLGQRQALAGLTEAAAATNAQAQQLENYAQQQLLEQSKQAQEQTRQQTAPITLRGPGSAATYLGGDGKMHVIQSPFEYETIGPAGTPDAGRTFRITQNAVDDPTKPYVRPPGVPAWAPPGTLSITQSKLAPGEEEMIKEYAKAFTSEQEQKQFDGATNTQRSMEELDAQFRYLNRTPGWYNTGEGADFRLNFARFINSTLLTSGVPPDKLPFDPQKVAAGEDIVKTSQLAGMSVLTQFFGGNREAASIVVRTQGAVPNIENSPQGAQLLVAGYREGAQYIIDKHAFKTNWSLHNNGDMRGADDYFNAHYPSAAYADRAISMVRPFVLTGDDPKEIDRFLPGTHVVYRNDPAGFDPKNPYKNVRSIGGDINIKLDPRFTPQGPKAQ